MHPRRTELPQQFVPVCVTRAAIAAYTHAFEVPRCRTVQFNRSFIPWSVSLWNDLDDSVFDSSGLSVFKSRANSLLLASLS